jgi:hypothetical protein
LGGFYSEWQFFGGEDIMRGLTRWAAIGIVAILGFMAKPSAAGPALAGVTFGTVPISGSYNYLTINPDGSNTYVIGSGPGYFSSPNNGSGVQYAVKTDALPGGNGGGFCQVDAIFASFLGPTAYFAVVTDSNPYGVRWDGYTPARFGPGDLNVTVTGGNNYGIGARPIDLQTAGSIGGGVYPDARSPATWTAYSTGSTPPSLTTSSADVVLNPTWKQVDNNAGTGGEAHVTKQGYFNPTDTGHTPFDHVAASWTQLVIAGNSNVGYTGPDPYYAPDQPYSTWIYEVAVPVADLGLVTGVNNLDVSFAPDCGNDSLHLSAAVYLVGGQVVPEPVSMIFFGTGLVAVGGYVARRRMLRKA